MTDRTAIQRLMSAAADGDRASVEPLFAALWPIVVGYAARFLGDPSLAEDCAQDALVRLFGQLDRFERDRDALTWALTHATWQCRTARRRRERRGETALEAVPEEGARLVTRDERETAIDRELVHAALDTLETLPARDREILYATLTDDEELRRALAPATFRKRLERALGRLRLSWRSRHGTL